MNQHDDYFEETAQLYLDFGEDPDSTEDAYEPLEEETILSDFSDLSDGEVALKAKDDSEALEYLLNKYKYFVRAKARTYFLVGADKEDLVQEGMIGLYKAIRDYDGQRQASFHVFAELCITRQIITAIKTATRQKHKPLNSYVSLNKPVTEEEPEKTLIDVISGAKEQNPETIMIDKESFAQIESSMEKMLSDLEWKVLCLFLRGKSYQEIAEKLGRQVKSIDNALQRVKSKLEKYLQEHRGQ